MCQLPAAIPAELAEALRKFRSDPPPGWSYTQTTVAEGRSTVERYDATRPAFARWSLLQKDGRLPTPEELQAYAEQRSRWSRSGTAPGITDQLNPDSFELAEESDDRAVYHARLRPGDGGDRTAHYLRVTLVLHQPSQSIESVELASTGPFRPALGVRIESMRTVLRYQLPAADRPALPQSVTTSVRGRAFVFKSLDADMTVTYSDFARASK